MASTQNLPDWPTNPDDSSNNSTYQLNFPTSVYPPPAPPMNISSDGMHLEHPGDADTPVSSIESREDANKKLHELGSDVFRPIPFVLHIDPEGIEEIRRGTGITERCIIGNPPGATLRIGTGNERYDYSQSEMDAQRKLDAEKWAAQLIGKAIEEEINDEVQDKIAEFGMWILGIAASEGIVGFLGMLSLGYIGTEDTESYKPGQTIATPSPSPAPTPQIRINRY